jgi:hypothetical protein
MNKDISKSSNPLSIYFYFPYHEDSGVPVLFYRMANEIVRKYAMIMVYLIDYENGAMARHLLKLPNVQLIPFMDGVKVQIPQDAVLVMQSFLPYKWPYELEPANDTKLFFWNLHPRNLVPSLMPFLFFTELPTTYWWIYRLASFFCPMFILRMKKFGHLLLNEKAIAFMDGPNYESTVKYLYLEKKDNIEFLPVPATISNNDRIKKKNIDIKKVCFCWVGRLCDFKSYSLVYTINKLDGVAKQLDMQIIYYIVGDGPLRKYVEDNISNNHNISVIFCGSMPHEELDDFLYKNVDILTAQGTSALEGAKLSIPTILIDASYREIKGDYMYRLLADTRNYDLGHVMTKSDFSYGNESLKEIVQTILGSYESQAEKAYLYFTRNHTIEFVVDKFLAQVSQTELTYRMINKAYFKKNWSLWLHDLLHPLYEKIIGRMSYNQ